MTDRHHHDLLSNPLPVSRAKSTPHSAGSDRSNGNGNNDTMEPPRHGPGRVDRL
eukprot:CAMPEP_0181114244 /NCGR_PEP_ID=MMETSP1071-20121207/20773_1 /TAXON_ID=35127 /ORGANISM="Thalassiosira sp., Strain NH16" /LENGTH=53 /DNA_ID=CAMNT_0023198327 /DNA_START=122 /DNA_END=280 /DNA_ORIENTATION=-